MSRLSLEEQFRNNAVGLCETICAAIDKLYKAGYKTVPPMIANLIPSAIKVMEARKLIDGFITGCHLSNPDGSYTGVNCWDYMKKRDEEFFLNNVKSIFGSLPIDNVNLFVDLFSTKDTSGKSIISQRTKDNVWEILDAMILISIKYIHQNRNPFSQRQGDVIKKMYSASFMDMMDMGANVRLWGVKLDFPLR
jgi:hypothetical protein